MLVISGGEDPLFNGLSATKSHPHRTRDPLQLQSGEHFQCTLDRGISGP